MRRAAPMREVQTTHGRAVRCALEHYFISDPRTRECLVSFANTRSLVYKGCMKKLTTVGIGYCDYLGTRAK